MSEISNFYQKTGGGNFLRSNLFRIVLGLISSADKNMEYFVTASALPEQTSETSVVNWMGSAIKFPGRQTFGDWSCTFREYGMSSVTYAYIDAWRAKIYSRDSSGSSSINFGTGAFGVPEDVKREIVLSILGPTGLEHSKYTLHGAFPISLSGANLDHSSENLLTFNVTFAYDFFSVEYKQI